MIIIITINLARMSKKWTSAIYAFFEPTPEIEYPEGRKCHTFKCMGKGCKQKIRRYLLSKDAISTRNMRWHVKSCWGEDAIKAADEARDAKEVCEKVVNTPGNHIFFLGKNLYGNTSCISNVFFLKKNEKFFSRKNIIKMKHFIHIFILQKIVYFIRKKMFEKYYIFPCQFFLVTECMLIQKN